MSSLSTPKNDQPRLSRGWRRMQEIAHESETERRAIEAELLVDLGRPPTAVDRIVIETLSAALIRARRLRAMGKNDTEQMRPIAQLFRATTIKSAPAIRRAVKGAETAGLRVTGVVVHPSGAIELYSSQEKEAPSPGKKPLASWEDA